MDLFCSGQQLFVHMEKVDRKTMTTMVVLTQVSKALYRETWLSSNMGQTKDHLKLSDKWIGEIQTEFTSNTELAADVKKISLSTAELSRKTLSSYCY